MISCDDVKQLLPGYLDGELSEAQARPARGHLLDCCACRELVQEGKVISRWFQKGQGQAMLAPQGFSARIARRAFAGDQGALMPVASQTASNASSSDRGARPILPFLLKLTAVAAILLFLFALQIKRQALPNSRDAEAANQAPPPWVEQPATLSADELLGRPAGAQSDAPMLIHAGEAKQPAEWSPEEEER
jgi:anti-sigma factor RsiW